MQVFVTVWITYQRYQNQREQGMTLVELLIVVLIAGILAAIGIPSLINQIGRARESEARVQLGALNRAQQAYFVEKGVFVNVGQINLLNVPDSNANYYSFSVVDEAVQLATGNDNGNNGTKDHIGAVQFSPDTRSYGGIICRSTNPLTTYSLTNTDVTNAGVNLSSNPLACNPVNAEEIK